MLGSCTRLWPIGLSRVRAAAFPAFIKSQRQHESERCRRNIYNLKELLRSSQALVKLTTGFQAKTSEVFTFSLAVSRLLERLARPPGFD